MAKIIQDVTKGRIKSAYLNLPFDKGKEALEKTGYKIIPLEKNAKLRMQEGKDAFISRNGNWVKEGVIYILKKGRFFTKNSPVLKNPKQATDAHRKGEEYFTEDEQVERALENSIEVPYNVSEIPTNRFGEDEITNFCFGKTAQDYGLFLKDNKINEMPLRLNDKNYVNSQKSSYANQLWLYGLGDGSYLYGDDRYLGCGSGVRGVLNETGEASRTQKLPYTQRQLRKVSAILIGVREGTLPASKLEKAIDFIEQLRK